MSNFIKIIILAIILVPVMVFASRAQETKTCPTVPQMTVMVNKVYPNSIFRVIPSGYGEKYVTAVKVKMISQGFDMSPVIATNALWVNNGRRTFVFFLRDNDTICRSITMPTSAHRVILMELFGTPS